MAGHKSRRSSKKGKSGADDQEFEALLGTARFIQNLRLSLDLAGILFVSAVEHAITGDAAYAILMKKLGAFQNPISKVGPLNIKRNARKTLKEIKEDQLTDALAELRGIEILYEPVVNSYALSNIAVVTAAETYINEVAQELIAGKAAKEHFDRLSVQGKWLFLPALIGKKNLFHLDREPLQSLNNAVRTRNKLVHFKGSGALLGAMHRPNFLPELGLLPQATKKSIEGVRHLIRDFDLAWIGSYGPDWLGTDEKDFRRPCFFAGKRGHSMTLWAEELDRGRHR